MVEVSFAASRASQRRTRLRRCALALAWATITWNSLEAVIAIATGAGADSIALIGFGLNSVIEVGTAVVVVWQFSGSDGDREDRAVKLIAASFFAFAAYVTAQSVFDGSSDLRGD